MNRIIVLREKLLFHKLCLLVFLSIANYSCEGSKEDVTQPSNLNLTITIQGANESNPNGDGSGKISCAATADNAVRYTYSFEGGDLLESTDGTIDYTFIEQGTNTYSVLVYAYSSSGESINKTQSVSVLQSDTTTASLVFSDEFNIDGSVDPTKWTYEIIPPNNGSWWNDEQQHYTDRADNVYVSDGTLKIVAKKENYTFQGSTKNYTSARIKTQDKFEFKYKKVEVRAKLPDGQGTWPAIWMLGANEDTVGWPSCGEIDIMEQTGDNKNEYLATLHWSNNGSNANYGTDHPDYPGDNIPVTNATSTFHVYTLEWSANELKCYADDDLSNAFVMNNNSGLPFNNDFFFILNVAMGGNLGKNIDPNFTEGTMEIDYIRVYQ
ncbi:MAG: glycoside hydrolase family 16 protein [Maribacter sp.]|nr:glycoside hydrolase family 16 protein [Maribacter sp.]